MILYDFKWKSYIMILYDFIFCLHDFIIIIIITKRVISSSVG